MAPCKGTQQWHRVHSTIAHCNGTLQWHPAMAPRPLNHSTLQWHPAMAPRPLHPAMAFWCHVQCAKVVHRPPPLLEVRTPIAIAIRAKIPKFRFPSWHTRDFFTLALSCNQNHSWQPRSDLWNGKPGRNFTGSERSSELSVLIPSMLGRVMGLSMQLHRFLTPHLKIKILAYNLHPWLISFRNWSSFQKLERLKIHITHITHVTCAEDSDKSQVEERTN